MKLSKKDIEALMIYAYNLGRDNEPFYCPKDREAIRKIIDMPHNIDDRAYSFMREHKQRLIDKDAEWFLCESNAQSCFYHLSKEEIEKISRNILVDYMVYNNLQDVIYRPITSKVLLDKCKEISWININYCKYRSMEIMLYKMFNIITWSKDGEDKLYLVYDGANSINNTAIIEDLKECGFKICAAIQDYLISIS